MILLAQTTRAVERAPHIPNCSIGQSSEVFGESVSKLIVDSRLFAKLAFNGLWPRGLRHGATWDKPLWEGVWPCLDPWDSVRLRTASTHRNVPGQYGPHGELF